MAQKDFNLGVKLKTNDALAGLRQLKKEFADTAKQAEKVGTSFSKSFKGTGSNINAITNSFKGLGSVIAGLGLGAIGTSMFQIVAASENLNTILKTVTGSAQGAEAAMSTINTVAAQTSFTTQQLGDTFIKMKAAGLDPTVEQLKLFADVASVTTDRIGSLQAISDLYARTTAGGLGLEELNRLADRGIPVFDILAKRIGVNRLQISELGKSAEGAKIIIQELEAGLKASFGGASAAQLNTLNGQFEQLKKNLTSFAQTVGGTEANEGLKELIKNVNGLFDALRPVGEFLNSTLGSAFRGFATVIKFVVDNWQILLTVLSVIPLVRVASTVVRLGVAIREAGGLLALFSTGFRTLVQNFSSLTAGFGPLKSIRIVLGETWDVLKNILLGSAGARGPIGILVDAFKAVDGYLNKILGTTITWLLKITGIGVLIDKIFRRSAPDQKDLPQSNDPTEQQRLLNRSAAQQQQAEQEKASAERQQRVRELLTGSSEIISKIVASIKDEAALIGLTGQRLEEKQKVLEAERSIREKLISAGKLQNETEAEFQKRVNETTSSILKDKSGEIRAAVAAKYSKQLEYQMKLFRENNNEEIRLLGLSANEQERIRGLREQLLDLGIKDTATAKQRAAIEGEIARLQNARINVALGESITAIRSETELLKLSNSEREKRNELDRIAQDAGFRNRADLLLNATAEQRKKFEAAGGAIDVRNQEIINQAGKKSIETLREELSLLSIMDEKERARVQTRQEIYSSIDPEGKGKNITDQQKLEIELLNQQIQAQKELIAVNEQINDSFRSIGDAVTQYLLGQEGGIRRLRLELIKLAALAAFRNLFGGQTTNNLGGSFFNGLIGGLSGGRAKGGAFNAGQAIRVGEQGPETVMFGQRGMVLPNTATIQSAPKGTTLVINPKFENHGTINSAEDLNNMFTQWSENIALNVKDYVTGEFGSSGLAYR